MMTLRGRCDSAGTSYYAWTGDGIGYRVTLRYSVAGSGAPHYVVCLLIIMVAQELDSYIITKLAKRDTYIHTKTGVIKNKPSSAYFPTKTKKRVRRQRSYKILEAKVETDVTHLRLSFIIIIIIIII